MIEEFLTWEQSVRPEIEEVSKILATPLSNEPEELIGNLQTVEAWNGRMGALLAQADSWLDRYKLVMLPSKDDGLGLRSEADRKIKMDKEVSPICLVRDTLEHFCDAIRQRLILGESILSYHKQIYMERKASSEDLTKIF